METEAKALLALVGEISGLLRPRMTTWIAKVTFRLQISNVTERPWMTFPNQGLYSFSQPRISGVHPTDMYVAHWATGPVGHRLDSPLQSLPTWAKSRWFSGHFTGIILSFRKYLRKCQSNATSMPQIMAHSNHYKGSCHTVLRTCCNDTMTLYFFLQCNSAARGCDQARLDVHNEGDGHDQQKWPEATPRSQLLQLLLGPNVHVVSGDSLLLNLVTSWKNWRSMPPRFWRLVHVQTMHCSAPRHLVHSIELCLSNKGKSLQRMPCQCQGSHPRQIWCRVGLARHAIVVKLVFKFV